MNNRIALGLIVVVCAFIVLSVYSMNRGFTAAITSNIIAGAEGDSDTGDDSDTEKCGAPCSPEDWGGDIGIYDIDGECTHITDYVNEQYCCSDKDCPFGKTCTDGKCQTPTE